MRHLRHAGKPLQCLFRSVSTARSLSTSARARPRPTQYRVLPDNEWAPLRHERPLRPVHAQRFGGGFRGDLMRR